MELKSKEKITTLDLEGLHFSESNKKIKAAVSSGATNLKLINANGQRYIGTGLKTKAKIEVNGTAGADLGMFMDGSEIIVNGNAQDAVGNTMNEGYIAVHGHAGDVCGIAMRGGTVFIKGEVGYRAGIHMKEYKDKIPTLIIGGTAHDFLGEYMAGGVLIVLNYLPSPQKCVANHIGTGMHGGVIYLRGEVEPYQLGKEVTPLELDDKDKKILQKHLTNFSKEFGLDYNDIINAKFTKLLPLSHRPYGQLYAY